MYFQKIGDAGTPILFLHGWGCDGSIFLTTAKYLGDFRRFLIDFNGFGKSTFPPEAGWNVEDYSEELKIFCKDHNLANLCIVAHSFGCRVAIVFASKYPEYVARILLFAPPGFRHFNLRRWVKVRRYKLSKLLNRADKTLGSVDYIACDAKMQKTFVKVVNQNLKSFAKNVKCPVLLVNGNKDEETPIRRTMELQKTLPNATLVEIEGDHFALFRNPKAFAEIINCFSEE